MKRVSKFVIGYRSIFHRPVILYFAHNTFLVFKFIVISNATVCSAGRI